MLFGFEGLCYQLRKFRSLRNKWHETFILMTCLGNILTQSDAFRETLNCVFFRFLLLMPILNLEFYRKSLLVARIRKSSSFLPASYRIRCKAEQIRNKPIKSRTLRLLFSLLNSSTRVEICPLSIYLFRGTGSAKKNGNVRHRRAKLDFPKTRLYSFR